MTLWWLEWIGIGLGIWIVVSIVCGVIIGNLLRHYKSADPRYDDSDDKDDIKKPPNGDA